MKVVILAGGFGTRISEESHLKPKPIPWHTKYTLGRTDNINMTVATGRKINYFSTNNRVRNVGYTPRFTSLDSVVQEFIAIPKSRL